MLYRHFAFGLSYINKIRTGTRTSYYSPRSTAAVCTVHLGLTRSLQCHSIEVLTDSHILGYPSQAEWIQSTDFAPTAKPPMQSTGRQMCAEMDLLELHVRHGSTCAAKGHMHWSMCESSGDIKEQTDSGHSSAVS